MDYLPLFIALGLFGLLLILSQVVRRVIIYEYERGLLFDDGRLKTVLEPGVHWFFVPFQTIQKVDVRQRHITITGQEVLTADNIGLKLSLALSYRVADPRIALTVVAAFQEGLYLEMQLVLRDLVGQKSVDDLLAARQELADRLLEKGRPRAAGLGLELIGAGIKDIMFPGDLKTVFAQVVNARKEGLAALERARGEQAALRNLANAARLLDNNPALMNLRILQTLGNSAGNSIVLEMGGLRVGAEEKRASD